jgi:cytidylate kinase
MNGVEPRDAEAVEALLPKIDIEVKYEEGTQCVYLNGVNYKDAIRTPEMSMYASIVSAIPAVRAFLLDTQRSIAEENSVVMDGRDIGTVILPNANVKIFLTASNECRAMRRYEELKAKGIQTDYESVLADMIQRDENDRNREVAPAVAAEDAVTVDNSGMTPDQCSDAIMKLIEEKLKK